MIIKDRSFPHPVLAPFKDDVLPNNFLFCLSVDPDADKFYIRVEFKHTNRSLEELIRTNQASYCVHLECRQNFFRDTFSFSEPTKNLAIGAGHLVGRVEATGFIKAVADIADYRIDGAHPDYGNSSFSIRPGDILAVAPSHTFDAYVDYDPLKQISSILTIRKSKSREEGEMELETSDDRIVATLSQRDFDRYTELKADPTFGPLLANQVVVPAILQAIHEIKDTPDDEIEMEMGKRWYRSISKKLDDLRIDIRKGDGSPLEAAQTILRLPLRRTLEGLMHIDPLEDRK